MKVIYEPPYVDVPLCEMCGYFIDECTCPSAFELIPEPEENN